MTIIKSPAWVSFIWLGMTAAISMLATSAKFSQDPISRSIVLDVERVIFTALNKAEFLALIILLILVRVSEKSREFLLPAATLALILIAQAVWLLPELAVRTELLTAGDESGQSMAQSVYSVLELIKYFLLIYLGFRSLQILATSQQFRK